MDLQHVKLKFSTDSVILQALTQTPYGPPARQALGYEQYRSNFRPSLKLHLDLQHIKLQDTGSLGAAQQSRQVRLRAPAVAVHELLYVQARLRILQWFSILCMDNCSKNGRIKVEHATQLSLGTNPLCTGPPAHFTTTQHPLPSNQPVYGWNV